MPGARPRATLRGRSPQTFPADSCLGNPQAVQHGVNTMPFWDDGLFSFEDPLNEAIWAESPALQRSIQSPETLEAPGAVGAQQAMLPDPTEVLPWVPDLGLQAPVLRFLSTSDRESTSYANYGIMNRGRRGEARPRQWKRVRRHRGSRPRRGAAEGKARLSNQQPDRAAGPDPERGGRDPRCGSAEGLGVDARATLRLQYRTAAPIRPVTGIRGGDPSQTRSDA